MNDDLLKAEFDNYKPTNKNLLESKQILQKYAANFKPHQPKSLLLQGSYGIGKSHLAMSVVR
ncbi:DNA replication protein DnaC, partial [Staphylococcus hominis]